MMPELTASTGAPRIATIARPFGLTMGLPGDAAGQIALLRATVRALAEILEPGGVVELPFEWKYAGKLATHPPEPPPIVGHLRRHPWLIPSFYNRIPAPPDHVSRPFVP
jgi:hypothetical protein